MLTAAAAVRGEITADLGEWFLQPAAGASVVRMSDVASEPIDWLWERWIPTRMLTILGGYGGDGKSTVMASLIGAWTTGSALPDGSLARRTMCRTRSGRGWTCMERIRARCLC
ncbi:MAG TPA: AAA family ATPase [Thermomicrobiales bacterium]|nr:AAA family ATPase [Thermomicrobiales bacterium]